MRYALPIATVLLLGSCAQVAEITGGDKDITAPKLVGAVPPDLSTRFVGSRIVLQFDERITLDRVRDRMLVSPPLDVPPNVRITGARNVTIELNAPLLPNTTYSFGIGEAVKDLTEGNVAAGLTYVISTGDALDSLQVRGKVTHAFSGVPAKEVLVMLYDTNDTTTIRTGRPAYATRSDATGAFLLDHIKPGNYRLFALRDQNANYRFDLPNEEVAFADSVLVLAPGDSVAALHHLRLFAEASNIQALRGARVTVDGALQLVLARPAEEVLLRDVARSGGVLAWTPEWSPARDTVLLWPSDTTGLREGRYELRCDGGVLDTLRYRPTERMPFFTHVRTSVQEREDGAVVLLRASRPLVAFDPARFEVISDSLPVTFSLQADSMDARSLVLRTDLPPGAPAQLTALPKAVRDGYGGHNDTLRAGIGRAAEASTGTLRVRLAVGDHLNGPFLLQLLDRQERVIREEVREAGQHTVVWPRLVPGDHYLRLITDSDGSGRWDTGNLDLGLQPERVRRLADAVNVRAAWDLAVDWSVE